MVHPNVKRKEDDHARANAKSCRVRYQFQSSCEPPYEKKWVKCAERNAYNKRAFAVCYRWCLITPLFPNNTHYLQACKGQDSDSPNQSYGASIFFCGVKCKQACCQYYY